MRNSLRFIRILTLLGLFTGLAGAQAVSVYLRHAT